MRSELQRLILEQQLDMLGIYAEQEYETTSIEEAGLEERMNSQPAHGFQNIPEIVGWFYDGESSDYDTN